MSDAEQIREYAARLYALARKAHDNNLDSYAAQLEELAAEASAQAEATVIGRVGNNARILRMMVGTEFGHAHSSGTNSFSRR